MPEFAECWALGYALDKLGVKNKIIGKHLIIDRLDYSFGLNGHIHIKAKNEKENLFRIEHKGYGIKGGVKEYNKEKLNLGLNFSECSMDEIDIVLLSWAKRNVKIGCFMLNQEEIAGIGVAWGSEILAKSNISPDVKTSTLSKDDIKKLCKTMIDVRDKALCDYRLFIDKMKNKSDLLEFVNGWFKNLYEVREMEVYKKSETFVIVNGRKFWIKSELHT